MEKNDKKEDSSGIGKSKTERIVFFSMISIIVIIAFGLLSVYAFPGKSLGTSGSGKTSTPFSGIKLGSGDGSTQTAVLSFDSKGYVITPNTLKLGVPVKMTVDTDKVTGCMRTVVIKDFGVRKYITPQDNVIEFTPDKEGTFLVACSMNMGIGFFSVTSDGTATADSTAKLQTQTASRPAGGATCGGAGAGTGSTGGCGCGMK
jgi:heme/copper-type cytochrome/quinol oxidase subunit 2